MEIKKNLFEGMNLTEDDMILNLQSMAYSETTKTFTMAFTDEEKSQTKEEYFETLAQLDIVEDEFKKHQLDYKNKKSVIERKLGTLKTQNKLQGFDTTEIVYMIDDQDNNVMNTYDRRGIFLESRPLYRSEKQMKLKTNIVLEHKQAANS